MGESKNGKPKTAFSTALHPIVAPPGTCGAGKMRRCRTVIRIANAIWRLKSNQTLTNE
jgi:hypothetical protein